MKYSAITVFGIFVLSSQQSGISQTTVYTGPTGDASAIVRTSNNVVVGFDETNELRTYAFNASQGSGGVASLSQDMFWTSSFNPLGLDDIDSGIAREVDVEDATILHSLTAAQSAALGLATGENVAIWIGSHSRTGAGANNPGRWRRNRHRVFGVVVNSNGPVRDGNGRIKITGYCGNTAANPSTSLAYALLAFDNTLPAAPNPYVPGRYRADISAAVGNYTVTDPALTSAGSAGLNIEGLADAGSGGIFVGLRSPLDQENRAIVYKVENASDLVIAANRPHPGASGSGSSISGDFRLNLGGRGVRAMARMNGYTGFVISAGSPSDTSMPPALYYWGGYDETVYELSWNVGDVPAPAVTAQGGTFNPEAIVGADPYYSLDATGAWFPDGSVTQCTILSDDGNPGGLFRMTKMLGGHTINYSKAWQRSGNNFVFQSMVRPGASVTIQQMTDGSGTWSNLQTLTAPTGSSPQTITVTDSNVFNGTDKTRVYRAISTTSGVSSPATNAVGFSRYAVSSAASRPIIRVFRDLSGNTLQSAFLPGIVDGLTIDSFDPQTQLWGESYIYDATDGTGWNSSVDWSNLNNVMFNPGTACTLRDSYGSSSEAILAGIVNTGTRTAFYAPLSSFTGSPFPVAGTFTNVTGIVPIVGDVVATFNYGTLSWTNHTWNGSTWSPATPTVSAGHSAVLRRPSPTISFEVR